MARAMASTCAQPDGVVLGAVVDLVAGLVRIADAEVIVVRGIDHHFVLELRIAARQHTRHVRGAHARDLVVELDRGAQVERHGLEVALLGRLDQLVEIGAARLHQAARGVFGGPALELNARLALGRQLELLAAPRRLHHLPRISRRRRGVHDDHARRAMTRGAFVLVGPAAVVQARLAREQLRIPVRIVVEHHEHLAAHVDALEVVPLVLGRFDAVAHEHQARVLDLRARLLHAAARDVILGPLECDVAALAGEIPGRRQLRRHADDVDGLFPAAVFAAGLEAQRFELAGEIKPRQRVAARGRTAAFEFVGGEKADRRAQDVAA